MQKAGVIDRLIGYLHMAESVDVFEGIGGEPSMMDVEKGVTTMREVTPDTVIAVGGGSAIDLAKAMVLFYEFPHLRLNGNISQQIPNQRMKTRLVAIPSTSGTGSEVTKTSVITDLDNCLKVPIIHLTLKPDVAILDSDLTMSMPPQIVAETGMDALTHAIECYTRHDLDDFDEVLAKGAIEGIIKWLPVSYEEKTPESREKLHNYQCLAGMSFTNVGVALVHGIAHAIGAILHISHGLANAIVLPYVLEYNRKDERVAEKLNYLSWVCGCADIVEQIRAMARRMNIPETLRKAGVQEEVFLNSLDELTASSQLGATKYNPIPMNEKSIRELLQKIYYGE